MKISAKICSALAVFAMGLGNSFGADYPDRPVRLIVPFAAGGPTDVLVRLISPTLNEELGQPVVIENKAGAGSVIGIAEAARAQADGYTYVVGGSAYAINASFMPKLPYDTLGDLKAVAPLAVTPFFLVVRSSLGVDSVAQLIDLAKKSPGKLTYASSGTGNSPHLAAAQFAQQAGLDLLHVPYKGTAPAINDLLAGTVDMVFTGLPSVASHVQSGRLKVLAVASEQRAPFAADIPTFAEAGVPGFAADAWFGILAPTGTPTAFEERFAAAVRKAIKSPDVVERFAGLGAAPLDLDRQAFQQYINEDVERWASFLKAHPQIAAQ